jgi:hypothetical protein
MAMAREEREEVLPEREWEEVVAVVQARLDWEVIVREAKRGEVWEGPINKRAGLLPTPRLVLHPPEKKPRILKRIPDLTLPIVTRIAIFLLQPENLQP